MRQLSLMHSNCPRHEIYTIQHQQCPSCMPLPTHNSSLHPTVRTWTELHSESVLHRCWSSVWSKLSCWLNSHCHQCLLVHRSEKTHCCSGAGHLLAACTRTTTQQAVTLSTIVMNNTLQSPPFMYVLHPAYDHMCECLCM